MHHKLVNIFISNSLDLVITHIFHLHIAARNIEFIVEMYDFFQFHPKLTTSMFCSKQVINIAGLGLQVFSPLGAAGILLASISKN